MRLKLLIKVVLVGLLFEFSDDAYAQNLTFYGLLPAVSKTAKINEIVDFNFFGSSTIDLVPETYANKTYPRKDLQLYLQPSLIYKWRPNLNFAGSYTYQRNNPLTDDYSNEHRLWQQAVYSIPFSYGKVTNRLRFEERWIQDRALGRYRFATRTRYQLGYSKPLSGRILEAHEMYFNTYNELYFSTTGPKNAFYSENWTYAGIGYVSKEWGKFELGPVFQTAVRNKNHERRNLLLLQLLWIFK